MATGRVNVGGKYNSGDEVQLDRYFIDWTVNIPSSQAGWPSYDNDGNVYAFAYPSKSYKYDSRGNLIWSGGAQSNIGGAFHDDITDEVFVTGSNGRLDKYDLNTGTITPLYSSGSGWTRGIYAKGAFIYVGCDNSKIAKLNRDGTIVWEKTISATSKGIDSIAVDDDGNVYLACLNGIASGYKLSPTGVELGHTTSASMIKVVYYKGYLYWLASYGVLYKTDLDLNVIISGSSGVGGKSLHVDESDDTLVVTNGVIARLSLDFTSLSMGGYAAFYHSVIDKRGYVYFFLSEPFSLGIANRYIQLP